VRNHRQRAVIVAMIAVRMVQVPTNQIIDVVSVGNRLVTTVGAMLMRRIMSTAVVLRRAAIRIRCSDCDHVFIGKTVMHMLQMAVVEIIDVALVPDRGMTTVRPVDVRRFGPTRMICGGHGFVLSCLLNA
jgi:hypothetical protein